MNRLLSVFLSLLLTAPLFALEGKWTPQQVQGLDAAWLRKQGLELPPNRLWDAKRGTGLLAAAISIGGCSAGFISPDGLFITNHHCLFGVLQEHSTPQNDLITNGFLARSREQELRGKVARVTIPRRFVDVTDRVLAAVPAKATDAERYRALERRSNEIVAECEKQPGMRCTVAAHDGGVQYVLQEMQELADVRLVYAPPRAIGEFGGEIDNWMWPRHTGDFAIGRAYVDGKPFKPEFWFPISTKGIGPEDFVMVLGYPGITYRALTADEMQERHRWFTARAELYREWIRILEETTKGNSEGEIAVADLVKTLANRQKNAEGQLAGFKRGRILEKQRASDQAVLAWSAGLQPAGGLKPTAPQAYEGLRAMTAEKLQTFDRDFLLGHVRMTPTSLSPAGPKALVFAVAVAQSAIERQKPDAERNEVFMERNLGRVRDRLERDQKSFFAPADKALLASFAKRAGMNDLRIDDLYAQTKLFDLGERLKMLAETPEQLHARRDPLVEVGFALSREIATMMERIDRWEGTISRLRPVWRRAVIAGGWSVRGQARTTPRSSSPDRPRSIPTPRALCRETDRIPRP